MLGIHNSRADCHSVAPKASAVRVIWTPAKCDGVGQVSCDRLRLWSFVQSRRAIERERLDTGPAS